MYFVLFYDYVDGIEERRGPYRAEHLSLLTERLERGEVVMAGAWADPVDGAAIIFRTSERSAVEEFVESDPYVRHGLVTGWRIRAWNVVVGG